MIINDAGDEPWAVGLEGRPSTYGCGRWLRG